ncbi:MAB_1171c family putative transporter [Saccharothrix xinjiangensis]|uniref:MAB_1171c family putative transporter n=1 Tax=Saccharothrix xinjiangensis TaxID=204798 RepID=A0ABV9Y6X2_9PSEU
MVVFQVLEWTCACAGLSAFAHTVPALLRRRRPRPATVALSAYFLCSGVSFLIALDAVAPAVGRALGDPDRVSLVVHLAVLALTAAQQVVLAHWTYPPARAARRARGWLVAFGAVSIVLVVLFAHLKARQEVSGIEETNWRQLGGGGYTVYLCLLFGALAVGQVETVRLSWRYARMANRTWLRRGMAAVVVGGSLCLLYSLLGFAEVAGHGEAMAKVDLLRWLVGDLGAALEIFGWTVPTWGRRLSALAGWVGRYRAYRRLRPLWAALYEASPAIALDPPRSRLGELVPPRDLRYRLYRRVIEIRDGQLALRRCATAPDVADGERRAEDEAAALWTALRARQVGGAPVAVGVPDVGDAHGDGGGDLAGIDGEVTWLLRVADSFASLANGVNRGG